MSAIGKKGGVRGKDLTRHAYTPSSLRTWVLLKHITASTKLEVQKLVFMTSSANEIQKQRGSEIVLIITINQQFLNLKMVFCQLDS